MTSATAASGPTRLSQRGLPALVGIEARQLPCRRSRAGSEVLLEYDPVVVHEKGHDSCVAVSRRPRDEGEAPDHPALRHVAVGPAGGIGPLPLQNAVVVAVVRRALAF